MKKSATSGNSNVEIIDDVVKKAKEESLALFLGAGVSFDSGIPGARALEERLLEVLPLDRQDVQTVLSSNLPFEAFMELLALNSSIDRLLDIFKAKQPNRNHRLVAKLTKAHLIKTIVTTNFDVLLETAFEEEGLERDRDYCVFYQEQQFSKLNYEELDQLNATTLLKLHGSICDEQSIRMNMRNVAGRAHVAARANALRYAFSASYHRNVLILGYSCSDLFDISPLIRSLEEPTSQVFLVEHNQLDEPPESITRRACLANGNPNPFINFKGYDMVQNTDRLVDRLYTPFLKLATPQKTVTTEEGRSWPSLVDDWNAGLGDYAQATTCATLLANASSPKRAIAHLERASSKARSEGNPAWESEMSTRLGVVYFELLDYPRATRCFGMSLRTKRLLGDCRSIALIYMNLGNIRSGLHDYKTAIRLFGYCLATCRPEIDEDMMCECTMDLGMAYQSLGDFDKAIEYYLHAIEMSQKLGTKYSESLALSNLANALYESGDFETAAKLHANAVALQRAIGERQEEAGSRVSLAADWSALGRTKKAIHLLLSASAMYRKLDDKDGQATTLGNLAVVCYDIGKTDLAALCADSFARMAPEMSDKWAEFKLCANIGKAGQLRGDYERASTMLERALGIARERHDMWGESACLFLLGTVRHNLGDIDNAIVFYEKAKAIFIELEDERSLDMVNARLAVAHQRHRLPGQAKKKAGRKSTRL